MRKQQDLVVKTLTLYNWSRGSLWYKIVWLVYPRKSSVKLRCRSDCSCSKMSACQNDSSHGTVVVHFLARVV
jgi:hypothetical protein